MEEIAKLCALNQSRITTLSPKRSPGHPLRHITLLCTGAPCNRGGTTDAVVRRVLTPEKAVCVPGTPFSQAPVGHFGFCCDLKKRLNRCRPQVFLAQLSAISTGARSERSPISSLQLWSMDNDFTIHVCAIPFKNTQFETPNSAIRDRLVEPRRLAADLFFV